MAIPDGSELIVISILAEILQTVWSLSTFEKGFLGTALYIGYTLGSLIAGPLSDHWLGRRKLLISCTFADVLLGFICAFVDNFWSFVLIRSLIGLGIGLSASNEKAYTVEMLP